MKKFLTTIVFLLFCATILALSVRGISGNPTSFDINNPKWKDEGPLELSPERGRFALALSLIENNSFSFSLPIARFATPDLGYINGKYVSLFAPLVSYIMMPGYHLGFQFNSAQVGAFTVIAVFALMNAFLVRTIARQLGAHPAAATFSALAFLFATPAFAYGVSLYQHHISTFLILGSVFLLLISESVWVLPVIWFLFAAAIPLDYPNVFLMAPIALYATARILFFETKADGIHIRFRPLATLTFITAIVPLAFFLWFNQQSYGNPFQLSGTVKAVKEIDAAGNPTQGQGETAVVDLSNAVDKNATGFFNSRNLLNGFFIHLISPDRGVLMYAPLVVIGGILGAISLYQTAPGVTALLVSLVGVNLVLYSLWGDPWGGWAFGSRYLVPGYAALAILMAFMLTQWKKRIVVLVICFLLFIYCAGVNTLGALTSNRNPPKVEVLALEELSGVVQKYTYDRNYDAIASNQSKSFVFQTYAKDTMTAWTYYASIVTALTIGAFICLLLLTV